MFDAPPAGARVHDAGPTGPGTMIATGVDAPEKRGAFDDELTRTGYLRCHSTKTLSA
jgi:hypothetical protein